MAKEVFDGQINYKEIIASINQSNPFGFRRLKPWENYKIYSNQNDGLIAALSNKDLDRVSSIYNAQEMQLDDEENEEEIKEDPS